MSLLSTFLSTLSSKPKLLVIYGPTACGKTALTLELATQYNGEVISADSRQIYRGMNIGTGKITVEEMQGIPHHMLDIRDISESYSVGEYVPEAKRIIFEIYARGKLPILSGGTGLFIDAIIGNFDLGRAEPDWEYRAELEKIRETEGEQKLWDMLAAIDPDYAAELDARNYRYVMRGLEVFRVTGKSKKTDNRLGEGQYDTFFLTPYDGNREALYEKINARVEQMFKQGLVEEVTGLIQNTPYIIQNERSVSSFSDAVQRRSENPGQINIPSETGMDPRVKPEDDGRGGTLSNPLASKGELDNSQTPEILEKLPGLNAIGYREVIDFLMGIKTLAEAIEAVQTNSRHYAKRQLTWFRRYQTEKIDGFFGA